MGRAADYTHVQDRTLLRSDVGQGGVDDPAALVVEDVRPDLAQRLWVGVAVEEVVLDLEVLAHRDEDLFGVLVGCLHGDA